MEGFIGIHLGAGQHSEQLRKDYKRLVNAACRKAAAVLREGGSALAACAQATAVLEDSALTNAGYGSNLTWGGGVECDAGVMDGRTLHHGAVGGVAGVKNPVLLAQLLCEKQRDGLSLGRVPPSFLVGEGARTYAVKFGITTVPPQELIAAESWKLYNHYKRKLKRFQEEQLKMAMGRLDTVGAVCMDSQGHVAASCSSGGIALKTAGRVGQAAVYASGVWAQNATADSPAVATCTSGCGEYLVRTMLAREAALCVLNVSRTEMSLHDCMRSKFLESPFLNDVNEKMGGIFVLKCNLAQDFGELLWSHSTNTMCVGYMSTADVKPKFRMSQLGTDRPVGKCLVVEGVQFHCRRRSLKRPVTPSNSAAVVYNGGGIKNARNGELEELDESSDKESDDILCLSHNKILTNN